MQIVQTRPQGEAYGAFLDRAMEWTRKDGSADDRDQQDGFVDTVGADGSRTQTIVQFCRPGPAVIQYVTKETDAAGNLQKVEFTFATSEPASKQCDVTAGQFERLPNGDFEGILVTTKPGIPAFSPSRLQAMGAVLEVVPTSMLQVCEQIHATTASSDALVVQLNASEAKLGAELISAKIDDDWNIAD